MSIPGNDERPSTRDAGSGQTNPVLVTPGPESLPEVANLALSEFDPDPRDFVGDGKRAELAASDARLPRRLVMTLLGEVSRAFVEREGFTTAASVNLVTGRLPIWAGEYRGEQIALAEVPVGAPAAVAVFEEALMMGVETAVAVGCCGDLTGHEAGAMLVPIKALRDEGTSFHYLPPGRWVETDPAVNAACVTAVQEANLPVHEVATWTTDAIFRETPAKVAARREEGCEVVEMECAGFAAVARFRGAHFGQILFSADSLAGDTHDVRDWGNDFREVALQVTLNAITRL